jgi:hypothetical protein
MKKIFLVTALLLLMTVPAFADEGSTGTLTMGSGDNALDCGLSSNVYATYGTDGSASAPSQWYVIGTYHVGGTMVYATAQDITALYKLKAGKTPGNKFTWTGLPSDSEDSNVWSYTVWEQL